MWNQKLCIRIDELQGENNYITVEVVDKDLGINKESLVGTGQIQLQKIQ